MKARSAAIKILKKYGVPRKILSLKSSILDSVKIAKEILTNNGLNPQDIQEVMKKVNEKVVEVERKAALNATTKEGIGHVLDFVYKKGLKQAIYTYNTHDNAKLSLEKSSLLHYFDIIAGRDNIENPKPHPDHLLYICNALNVDTSEIIVIGDMHRDIEGGLNVGAKTIALKTRLFAISEKNEEIFNKADKIVNEKDVPLKLLDAIGSLL